MLMSLKVLHVSESYGGGVLAAIRNYMQSTPELEHHLLYGVHDDAPASADSFTGFASTAQLPGGHLAAIHFTREYARRLKPDVVHAHSSFAGAYVRLGMRAARGADGCPQLVYTPHCYAFERRSLSIPVRLAYRLIEGALAWNTDVFAVCSGREAALSKWLVSHAQITVVPNIAPITRRRLDSHNFPDRTCLTIAGAGRIRPGHDSQKDPLFFLSAIESARAACLDVNAVWVGGGDEVIERRLRDAGIRVTGWLDRAAVLDTLANADIYLHTAAWEGFPIAVLEVEALGVAQILRAIPAFANLGFPATIASARDFPATLAPLYSGKTRHANAVAVRDCLDANTPEGQHAALLEAWSLACE